MARCRGDREARRTRQEAALGRREQDAAYWRSGDAVTALRLKGVPEALKVANAKAEAAERDVEALKGKRMAVATP